ncbi:MAG: hypothetical protein LH469_04975, partial [Frankiaceae bacterium]|nr:hypothetical protein [Frankiaceae bacterium]
DAPAAPQERTQPPAPGGIDAAALRAARDTVLGAVKTRKRTAHAQLADATVSSVSGRTLVLAFQHAPILRQFQAGTGPDVLKEALQETLGAAMDLRCVLHESLSAHAHPAPGAARSAPEPAPEETGFAPGDEAVPDDPDAPPAEQAPRGEDAALRLVVDQLGGKVVSTSGED